MTSKQEFIEKLRNSSLRPTKQRINICEVLFNRDKTFHFTINDLFNLIKDKTGEKVSLATVYNTVHAFHKKGLIKLTLIQMSQITTISLILKKKSLSTLKMRM